MLKTASIALAGVAILALSVPADAHRAHHHKGHAKKHAAKVHYGGKPGLGYWRRGPERGYGFRFSSYKGDPFGADDYFDGDRCYYQKRRNFCVANKIFNGFWDEPTVR
ncbi:MAG: hypothetical protein ABL897_06770 [Hyphomicrobium sp.]